MPLESPPAPPATPSPAAPPAPAAPAAHKPPGPSLSGFDDHFNDLESPTTPEPKSEPASPATPDPKVADPKPDDRPKDPQTGKFIPKIDPKAEPKAEPKAPEKPADDEYTPPTVATGTQLRRFAVDAGAKLRKAANELNQLRSEVAKLKTSPREDASALTQELASAKKRIEQYENDARLTRYERSEEYRSKYEQPYQNAVRQAYGDVKELLVSEANPADPDNPREREATPADFDEIYNLPLGPATKLAKAKFGDAAGIVLQHRSAIKNAAKAALDAVEANKGNAATYEQQQTAQQRLAQEARSQMFATAIEDLQTKYPDRFGERDGDTEWNEARAKGLSMADMAFSDRQGLNPQQSAILDAQIRMRAAHYSAERAMRVKLEAENKQLKADLEKVRGSSPGAILPNGKAPEAKARNWQEEFDQKVPG